MAMKAIKWVNYPKHLPRNSTPWSVVVKNTTSGEAKYKHHINVRQLEESAVEHIEPDDEKYESLKLLNGRQIEPRSYRRIYLICDETIGASNGKETDIVRVEWQDDGTLHGRPVTEKQLIDELRAINPDELDFYKKTRG